MTHKVIADLEALVVQVDQLRPMAGNPRLGNVDSVARSLDRFGQRKPVVVRRATGEVIAGNHTLAAARQLGWSGIAAVFTDDDELEAKGYSLADNRTSDLGGYDHRALFSALEEVGKDPDLFAATSFTAASLESVAAYFDTSPAEIPAVFGVIVECRDEAEQLELLDQLEAAGHSVRALL